MFVDVLQVIAWILFSSVKFLFAPSTVYLAGYTYWQTIGITITGGILGVCVFFYTGSAIFNFISRRFPSGKKEKKVFSRRNRLLIRVKSSWGLYGIALISPCLISIPLGAFIAAKYFRQDRRTIPVFIGAVIFWSFTLTTSTALVGPLFD